MTPNPARFKWTLRQLERARKELATRDRISLPKPQPIRRGTRTSHQSDVWMNQLYGVIGGWNARGMNNWLN